MSEEINFDIGVDDLLQATCTNDLGSSSLEFVQQDEFDMEMLFDEFEMPSDVDSPQKTALETEINGPSNQKEFVELSSNDIQSFIAEQENKNTRKKTLYDVMKFKRFLENKNQYKEIHEIDPDQLDEYLANFCLSVRKPDGSDYEPSSLRNIVSSIDRNLKRHKYPSKIFGDNTNTFQLTRDAVQAKLKSLKRSGKGNKPQKSSPITDYEINILYEKGILGGSSGKSLLNTLWFNNCVIFGLRGTKENYNLRWGDVRLSKASDGSEYLELTQRQTKTRNGQNTSNIREVKPKIFAFTKDPSRCPVEMYKLYASKRPTDYCEPQHPFYIVRRTNSQSHDNVWFNKLIVEEKKNGSLLKVMAKDGGLDENNRLTNHSTRKHLVKKLRDSGIAPTDIMQISGHKNIQSVMNYSSMSEEKNKKCSNLLSNTRLSSSAIAETVTTQSQEKYKNEQTFSPSNVKSDLADTTQSNPESFHPPTAPAVITDQDYYDRDVKRLAHGYYFFNNQEVAIMDGLERLQGYKYMASFDTDEYLVPAKNETLISLFDRLFKKYPDAAGFIFGTYLYITNWKPASNGSIFTVGTYLSRTDLTTDRNKHYVLPERVRQTFTHRFSAKKPFRGYRVLEADAAIRHYRRCRRSYQGRNETCFQFRRYTDNHLYRVFKPIEKQVLRLKQQLGV